MRSAMVATSWDGGPVRPIEAARIALGSVRRWLHTLQPDHVVWAFDHPDANWREYLYPAYKQHRTVDTTPYADAVITLLPPTHRTVREPGYEADDCIATLVHFDQGAVSIITVDSDYFQLCRDAVVIHRPVTGGGIEVWDGARVCTHHDIATPQLYVDWKALVGDKSDGIPGVPKIGPKTASKLLREHGSLLACVQAGVLGEHAQNALLWQSLIRLRQDVRACSPTPSE
jgi:DNA polymerase-1